MCHCCALTARWVAAAFDMSRPVAAVSTCSAGRWSGYWYAVKTVAMSEDGWPFAVVATAGCMPTSTVRSTRQPMTGDPSAVAAGSMRQCRAFGREPAVPVTRLVRGRFHRTSCRHCNRCSRVSLASRNASAAEPPTRPTRARPRPRQHQTDTSGISPGRVTGEFALDAWTMDGDTSTCTVPSPAGTVTPAAAPSIRTVRVADGGSRLPWARRAGSRARFRARSVDHRSWPAAV
jgi:hypothetical protein